MSRRKVLSGGATACFDFVGFEDVDAAAYLAEDASDHVIIAPKGGAPVCFTRTQLYAQLDDNELQFYDCVPPRAGAGAGAVGKPIKDVLYSRLQMRDFNVIVPSTDLGAALRSHSQVWDLQQTDEVLAYTGSAQAFANSDYVSADHCQDGTSKSVWTLSPRPAPLAATIYAPELAAAELAVPFRYDLVVNGKSALLTLVDVKGGKPMASVQLVRPDSFVTHEQAGAVRMGAPATAEGNDGLVVTLSAETNDDNVVQYELVVETPSVVFHGVPSKVGRALAAWMKSGRSKSASDYAVFFLDGNIITGRELTASVSFTYEEPSATLEWYWLMSHPSRPSRRSVRGEILFQVYVAIDASYPRDATYLGKAADASAQLDGVQGTAVKMYTFGSVGDAFALRTISQVAKFIADSA